MSCHALIQAIATPGADAPNHYPKRICHVPHGSQRSIIHPHHCWSYFCFRTMYASPNPIKNPNSESKVASAKPAILPPQLLPSVKPPNKPMMVSAAISSAKGRARKKILPLTFSFRFVHPCILQLLGLACVQQPKAISLSRA